MHTVTIIISHEEYEQIKKDFAQLHKIHGIKYGHHYNTKYVLHHEWKSKNDIIEIDYIIDQKNPTRVVDDEIKPSIEKAWIIYTWDINSLFQPAFYNLLNKVSPYYIEGRIEFKPPDTKIEIIKETPAETITIISTPEKEAVKSAFLESVGIDSLTKRPFRRVDFSKSFIDKTLDAIDKGIFKGVYEVRYAPLCS